MKEDGIHINVAVTAGYIAGAGSRPIYRHYFAVYAGWNTDAARHIINDLKVAFPGPAYKVTALEWQCSGRDFK